MDLYKGQTIIYFYFFFSDETIFLTILRDPIQTFISMWDYYNLDQMFFNHNLSISEFFNKKNLPQDVTVPEISLKHVLLHDFGVPLKTNEEMIDKKIREIEETFDLVMIVEHFDASMVLLRNLLQWNFEDLTSLKLNARQSELLIGKGKGTYRQDKILARANTLKESYGQ